MLLLAALCGAHVADAAQFTETIDSGWVDRWTHSSADKYTGKFVAEAPPGLSDVALKVRAAAPAPALSASFSGTRHCTYLCQIYPLRYASDAQRAGRVRV